MKHQPVQVRPSPVTEHVSSHDGTKIGYTRTGAGPPLLLVHGTTADHTRWDGISTGLQKHFTVYAMDRRGRGNSGDTPVYDIEREFEDVAAVIDTIGKPVNVIGHSYGALCCLEAALLTDKIRSLILYEPPIPTGREMYPPGVLNRIQKLVDENRLEQALEMFFREIVKMPDHEFEVYRSLPVWQIRIALAPTIPRESLAEQSYQFQPEKFGTMNTPTLLILGGDSSPPFKAAIRLIDEALPNSRVVILSGQQHVAMDTAPEQFFQVVMPFLMD